MNTKIPPIKAVMPEKISTPLSWNLAWTRYCENLPQSGKHKPQNSLNWYWHCKDCGTMGEVSLSTSSRSLSSKFSQFGSRAADCVLMTKFHSEKHTTSRILIHCVRLTKCTLPLLTSQGGKIYWQRNGKTASRHCIEANRMMISIKPLMSSSDCPLSSVSVVWLFRCDKYCAHTPLYCTHWLLYNDRAEPLTVSCR